MTGLEIRKERLKMFTSLSRSSRENHCLITIILESALLLARSVCAKKFRF